MNPNRRNRAFSLTEVLMAAGILVVGFLLIAGTLPVGIKLTALSTERTIGVVAAEEAMAKIHLFGKDPNTMPYDRHVPYDGVSIAQYMQLAPPRRSSFISPQALTQLQIVYPGMTGAGLDKFFQSQSLYPSTAVFDYSTPGNPQIKTDLQDPPRYFWSALCRRLDATSTETQVTIFVCRMTGQGAKFPRFDYDRPSGVPSLNPWTTSDYPTPVPVELTITPGTEIRLRTTTANPLPGSGYYFTLLRFTDVNRSTMGRYIVEGATLLDDRNGRIMRVLEVTAPDPANSADYGQIRLIRQPDLDGIATTIEAADMEGLFMFTADEYPTITSRIVWVIPPAGVGTQTTPTNIPPRVAGRNPCVGVFQGQL